MDMNGTTRFSFALTGLLLVLNQLFSRHRWGWGDVVKFLEANGRVFVEQEGDDIWVGGHVATVIHGEVRLS